MKLIMVLLLSAGCATTSDKTIQLIYQSDKASATIWPDKKMEKQFSKYWFNRFSGEIQANYAAEYPYFRERVSFPKYQTYVQHAEKNALVNMEIFQIRYVSDYLVAVDCLATIQIGSKIEKVSIIDRWVLVDEEWFHVIRDPLFRI
jgi:hypothetical protein